MSKHTPGPWTIKRDETADERGMWIIEYRDLVSEEKYGFKPWMSTIAEVGGPYDKEEANAHLIAAAPRMLEGLKMAQRIILKMSHLHNIELKKDVIGDIIAEAEGTKLK